MINLHIIGVQKSGTTALASFLNQHPDIYVIDGKEAHVFDHPNFSQHPNPSVFINTKYNSKLSSYTNESIICDATPITIYHEPFLQACYHYNPDAKFILMLRDPVERAVSQFHMSKRIGAEKRCMLIAFLLEAWRLKQVNLTQPWSFDSPLRNHSYLHRGLYSQQLKRLYRIVPRKQTLVLMQSDLKQQHSQTLQRIFNFIGVDNYPINPQAVFKTEQQFRHWSDKLARIIARLYFKLKRESAPNWQKIIDG